VTTFNDATTAAEVIGQLVGACSTTRFWDEMPPDYPSGAGVFVSERAQELVDAALAALSRLDGNVVISVAGTCPSCGGRSLVVDDDDEIDCIRAFCKRPTAAHELLNVAEHVDHVVVLFPEGFEMKHPLIERLDDDLFSCALHCWISEQTEPPREFGTYRVAWSDGAGWQWTPIQPPEHRDDPVGSA